MVDDTEKGLSRGLTNYGDKDFSLYLRRSFAKAMGFSGESLEKPIIGITDTASSYNNCHRNVPEQIEAVKRGKHARVEAQRVERAQDGLLAADERQGNVG